MAASSVLASRILHQFPALSSFSCVLGVVSRGKKKNLSSLSWFWSAFYYSRNLTKITLYSDTCGTILVFLITNIYMFCLLALWTCQYCYIWFKFLTNTIYVSHICKSILLVCVWIGMFTPFVCLRICLLFFMCVSVRMCTCAHRTEEGIRPPEASVSHGGEPLNVGAENRTQILWENSGGCSGLTPFICNIMIDMLEFKSAVSFFFPFCFVSLVFYGYLMISLCFSILLCINMCSLVVAVLSY